MHCVTKHWDSCYMSSAVVQYMQKRSRFRQTCLAIESRLSLSMTQVRHLLALGCARKLCWTALFHSILLTATTFKR